MKNLFLIFLLAFSLMSFTNATASNAVIDTSIADIEMESSITDLEIESLFTNIDIESPITTTTTQVENLEDEDFPCRWRTCVYVNGVLVGCTAWTYGDCIIIIR